jgi:hypothetical protein
LFNIILGKTLLPPYDLWGAPSEIIKMSLSVTRATNTPQNTLQL